MPMSASGDAIAQGIVPGPRLLVATRALVATGSYGPKTTDPEAPLLGAEEADGPGLVAAARRQIGAGADVVKFYADYRWRPGEPSRPTFTIEEMRAATEVGARRRPDRRRPRLDPRRHAPRHPRRRRHDRAWQ